MKLEILSIPGTQLRRVLRYIYWKERVKDFSASVLKETQEGRAAMSTNTV
jgi:hypothetical protein